MPREERIKDFFAFLKESRQDEDSIYLVIGRLGLEIQQERLLDSGQAENEYLVALVEIKDGPLKDYLYFKTNGSGKDSALSFRKLMDSLLQDVRLHGLGRAY